MSGDELAQGGTEPQPDEAESPIPIVQQPGDPQSEPRNEAHEQVDDGRIHFRRSHFYAALIPVTFVTGLAVGYLLWGRDLGQPASAASTAPTETARFDVSVDDDPVLGPQAAAITIIEFSDFNCPYCRQFHQTTFDDLLAAYPDQIRFVYRDFPITSQESFVAAQAAECADEQGAFWEYHDALFSSKLELGDSAYRQYADELGLDSEALVSCVEAGRFADEVQADARYAAGLGVSGTPTFFVNGIPLVGAQPLSEFKRVIESELN